MPMLTYRPYHVPPREFFQFWRRIYGDDKVEKLYSDNIRRELTDQRILELFQWKNGYRFIKEKRGVRSQKLH